MSKLTRLEMLEIMHHADMIVEQALRERGKGTVRIRIEARQAYVDIEKFELVTA